MLRRRERQADKHGDAAARSRNQDGLRAGELREPNRTEPAGSYRAGRLLGSAARAGYGPRAAGNVGPVEATRLSQPSPTTLIVFALNEQPYGVLLTITESGFNDIPLARRAKAFAANDSGWSMQLSLAEKYLAQTA